MATGGHYITEKMEYGVEDIVAMDQDMLTTCFSQCQNSLASSKKYKIYRCKLLRTKCIHTFAGRNDEECRKEMGLHLTAHVNEIKRKAERNPKYYSNERYPACITWGEYKEKYPKAKRKSLPVHSPEDPKLNATSKSPVVVMKRKNEGNTEAASPKRHKELQHNSSRPVKIKQEYQSLEELSYENENVAHKKSAMLSAMGLAPTEEVNNTNLARGRIRTRTSLRKKLSSKNEEQAKELVELEQTVSAATGNSYLYDDRKYNFRKVMNKNVKSSSRVREKAANVNDYRAKSKYSSTETVGEIVQLPLDNGSEEDEKSEFPQNKMMLSNNATPPKQVHNPRKRKRRRRKIFTKQQNRANRIIQKNKVKRLSDSSTATSSRTKSLTSSIDSLAIKKEKIDDEEEESFFPNGYASNSSNSNFEIWKENNLEYQYQTRLPPIKLDPDIKHKLHCVLHDHWYWDGMERPILFPELKWKESGNNSQAMRECVAFGCGRTLNSKPKVALYKFPNPATDKERYERWVEIVRRTRPSWCGPTSHPDVFDSCVLCELHFTQECFKPISQLQRVIGFQPELKKDALPCNFFISEKDFLLNEKEDDNEAYVPSYADLLRKVQEVKNDQFITRDEAIEKLKAIQILMQYQKNKDKKDGNEIYSMAIKQGEVLVCEICKKMFTSVPAHQNHLREHAGFSGLKPHTCKVCGKSFTRLHSLSYHQMVHKNSTRFKCEYCGRGFRHPSHFKEHINSHTGAEPYECLVCNKTFKTSNSHRRHLMAKHGMKTNKDRSSIKNSPVSVKMQDNSPVLTVPSNKSSVGGGGGNHPIFEALNKPIRVKVMPLNKIYEITMKEILPEKQQQHSAVLKLDGDDFRMHPNNKNRDTEATQAQSELSKLYDLDNSNDLPLKNLEDLSAMFAKLSELNSVFGQAQGSSGELADCDTKLDLLKNILDISKDVNDMEIPNNNPPSEVDTIAPQYSPKKTMDVVDTETVNLSTTIGANITQSQTSGETSKENYGTDAISMQEIMIPNDFEPIYSSIDLIDSVSSPLQNNSDSKSVSAANSLVIGESGNIEQSALSVTVAEVANTIAVDGTMPIELECDETIDGFMKNNGKSEDDAEAGKENTPQAEILPFVQAELGKAEISDVKQLQNQDIEPPLNSVSDFTVFEDNLPLEHTMREMFKNSFLDTVNAIDEE